MLKEVWRREDEKTIFATEDIENQQCNLVLGSNLKRGTTQKPTK